MGLPAAKATPTMAAAGTMASAISGPAITLRRYATTIVIPARAANEDTSTSRSVGSVRTFVSGLPRNSPVVPKPVKRKTAKTSAAASASVR